MDACRALLDAGELAQALELLRALEHPPEAIVQALLEKYPEPLAVMDILLACASAEATAEQAIRLFSADCAAHVLPVYARHFPAERLERAIWMARQLAHGAVTPAAAEEASSAAHAAARETEAEYPRWALDEYAEPEIKELSDGEWSALVDVACRTSEAAALAASYASSEDLIFEIASGGGGGWEQAVAAKGEDEGEREAEQDWQRQRLALYCLALLSGEALPEAWSPETAR